MWRISYRLGLKKREEFDRRLDSVSRWKGRQRPLRQTYRHGGQTGREADRQGNQQAGRQPYWNRRKESLGLQSQKQKIQSISLIMWKEDGLPTQKLYWVADHQHNYQLPLCLYPFQPIAFVSFTSPVLPRFLTPRCSISFHASLPIKSIPIHCQSSSPYPLTPCPYTLLLFGSFSFSAFYLSNSFSHSVSL